MALHERLGNLPLADVATTPFFMMLPGSEGLRKPGSAPERLRREWLVEGARNPRPVAGRLGNAEARHDLAGRHALLGVDRLERRDLVDFEDYRHDTRTWHNPYQADLNLRALEPSDLDRTRKWHNDAALYQTLIGPFRHVSRAAEEEWIRRKVAYSCTEIQLAICLREGDRHIGNVNLSNIDWIVSHRCLGIFIGEAQYRSNGYGQQVVRLMLRHAFHDLGLRRAYLPVLEDNPGAIRVYEKCGFVIVSISLVADPFGNHDRALLDECFDVVIPFMQHFVADLKDPPETFVSRHHRKYQSCKRPPTVPPRRQDFVCHPGVLSRLQQRPWLI